ncbi:MAG: hypothetical protein Q8R78_05430 [Candidatus Omnitrophota bacterium]|nr:hypothetical protein [Candidatus Omnitrophota bacterium]
MTTGTRRLKPDLELNALVAERVLGWRWMTNHPMMIQRRHLLSPALSAEYTAMHPSTGEEPISPGAYSTVPDFCLDLNAAMMLVSALQEMGFWIAMNFGSKGQRPVVRWGNGLLEPTYDDALDRQEHPAKSLTVAAILATDGDPYVAEPESAAKEG